MQALNKAQYASWVSSIPSETGRMMLAAIATATLLVLSANMYIDGAVSLTVVVLIQLYVVKLIAATMDIAEIIKRYEMYMGSAYEPVRTMLIEPTIKNKIVTTSLGLCNGSEISFENVTFRYGDGNRTAISNFSLTVRTGEKIGIVGYSGSGKTTLTKLLMRFMDIQKGCIRLGGVDISDMDQQDLRTNIAYVPQEPLLFHRSIAENIAYGKPDATRKLIERLADDAFVTEFASDMPEGLETLVGEHGVKLSGGQRQRVAIARAMIKNAPILILDEATSALDSRSEKYIQKALWKLMKGKTAIVIAHRLSTIQKLDRIIVVDKGRIVQSGSHNELLNQAGIYAELWNHQSGGYIGQPIIQEANLE